MRTGGQAKRGGAQTSRRIRRQAGYRTTEKYVHGPGGEMHRQFGQMNRQDKEMHRQHKEMHRQFDVSCRMVRLKFLSKERATEILKTDKGVITAGLLNLKQRQDALRKAGKWLHGEQDFSGLIGENKQGGNTLIIRTRAHAAPFGQTTRERPTQTDIRTKAPRTTFRQTSRRRLQRTRPKSHGSKIC